MIEVGFTYLNLLVYEILKDRGRYSSGILNYTFGHVLNENRVLA